MDENIVEKWLPQITSPTDLKAMTEPEIRELAAEIRERMIETVSRNGGHLASNLGVVELTLALHRVFDVPHDKIVWDVGHQCYTHKLVTGREKQFHTLRTQGGITGFPNPGESEYDCFMTGHSSTSISAANGIAKAKALKGDDGYVIAVIGDGALTGGLAYEGLSNAGRSHDRLIVVLNDNRMSIDQNVGFMARHLSNMRATPGYIKFKKSFGLGLRKIPLVGKPLYHLAFRTKMRMKTRLYDNSSLFEDMGLYYLGPVDGHNIHDLSQALEAAKAITSGPVLLHVETVKGQGYRYALEKPNLYHGIGSFDKQTGKPPESGPSFSKAFGDAVVSLAEKDDKICLITAAMTGGTGLTEMAEKYAKRCFDVGIAEEHAVTFAAGLATEGMLPIFAVYSSFLQRCYDQLLNDVTINGQHIVLAIDRSGIVPDDGETHQGIFDVPFLTTIPNMTIFAPSTFAELPMYLSQALYETDGIAAVRYPKGGELPCASEFVPDYQPFTWYRRRDSRILLITYGRIFANVISAAAELEMQYPHVSVLKLNRIFPIDEECVKIAMTYQRVLFFEEGSRAGGIAEQFGTMLAKQQFSRPYEIYAIEQFIPTCKVDAGLELVSLDVGSIINFVRGSENTAVLTDAEGSPEETPASDEVPAGSAEGPTEEETTDEQSTGS